jgi:hypothetical protein
MSRSKNGKNEHPSGETTMAGNPQADFIVFTRAGAGA